MDNVFGEFVSDGRRMLKWAALLGTMMVAAPASAATYHLIAKTSAGVGFVDVGSIQKNESLASIWSTLFLFKDGANGAAGTSTTAVIMAHDQYDCLQNRSRHLSMQSYDAKGSPTDSYDQVAPWKDVVPDSNDAVSERLACDVAFTATDPGWTSDMLPMLNSVRSIHGWK